MRVSGIHFGCVHWEMLLGFQVYGLELKGRFCVFWFWSVYLCMWESQSSLGMFGVSGTKRHNWCDGNSSCM